MISSDQLTDLIGSWAGSEQLFPTAWTAAGSADGVLTIRTGPGDALLLDYEQRSDVVTLNGHGVIAADRWWWFDSYGFIPAAPGTARLLDGRLLLERSSGRGRTLTTLELVGGKLEQRIDSAVPADAELIPLMRSSYTRLPHPNADSD
jgi:hypothetical protein